MIGGVTKAVRMKPSSSGGNALYGQVFVPENYGAKGDGTTDDTVALQAAITAAQGVNGTVQLSAKTYKITASLSISAGMTIRGSGVAPLWGSNASFPNVSSVLLSQTPFISGSVILQSVAATDALVVSVNGSSVDFYDFGIRFADAIKFSTSSTGHGINCTPPTYNTGQEWGVEGCTWNNIWIYGHDGNHYAVRMVNSQNNNFSNIQTFGGGGFEFYNNAVTNPQFSGNSTYTECYVAVYCGGTANGYYLHKSSGSTYGVILQCFIRPQCFFIEGAPGQTNPPSTAQYQFVADSATQTLTILGGDFEGEGDGGGGISLPAGLGTGTDHSFVHIAYQATGGATIGPIGFLAPYANGSLPNLNIVTNLSSSTSGGFFIQNCANIKLNTGVTTVNGSTSGTAGFIEPANGTGLKIIVIKLAALLGTASYNFFAAFASTPLVLTTSGLAASVVTANSTTGITVTGATTTGVIILMGI